MESFAAHPLKIEIKIIIIYEETFPIDRHLSRQLIIDESSNSYVINVRKNITENGKSLSIAFLKKEKI